MKIVTVIGARPQIIKAAAISREIKTNFSNLVTEVIVHTGQHYDENMSQIFFDELQVPKPDYNLNVGSAGHEEQTAKMVEGLESVLLNEKPDAVLVYGDTNSTRAGGITASEHGVPLIHIEAGLRSFNKSMPEELNRIFCDHASTLLFSPTKAGVENLVNEGFDLNNEPPFTADNPKVYYCGDIMYDNSLYFSEVSDNKSCIIKDLGLSGGFVLATVHRDSNTDSPARLQSIFEALLDIGEENDVAVVLPIHPRTKKMMEATLSSDLLNVIDNSYYLKIVPPVSFLDVIALEKNAEMVITDSGGVQKEAFFFQKPCLILRAETEWVEIVEAGNAILCDADKEKIKEGFRSFKENPPREYPQLFGDGNAANFICNKITKHLS